MATLLMFLFVFVSGFKLKIVTENCLFVYFVLVSGFTVT
jgi:hypothetical protein